MKISDIIPALGLKTISGNSNLDNEIKGAYVSDLLSDVMGNAKEGQIWITLQTHQNVIAVAALKDLSAIIIVNGATPDSETIEKGNIENIPVLCTDMHTFEVAGRLFDLLKTG
jgi:predicted transcriptional regulator